MKKDTRKTISPIIGSYLKDLRLKLDLNQLDLAEKLGLSQQVIGFYENAKRLPSVKSLRLYAKTFDIDISLLLDLREATIFETVDLLGEDTPLSIKNERNMLVHTMGREFERRHYDEPFGLSERSRINKANFQSRRAEERAKIQRSILVIDDIETTEEEYDAAVNFIRQLREQED